MGMFRLFAEPIAKHLETRRKIAEVETAPELARSAMESNTDCVMVLDLDGHLLSMNQNGCRQMELEDFAAVASRPWRHLWEEPETRKAVAALESARDGKESRFSGLRRTAKGEEKYWEVSVAPIMDAHGKPARILAIARDVTIRRVEEAQLRQTARLESLGVLAGGIAHDFNNLLTGILGNASLLEEASTNREQISLASEIVRAAESAADLTRQLLAYSGKGRLLVERIDLSATILKILNLIRTTIDKKVEIVLSLDEDLPTVEADPAQIQQLIMNLIINASEAMNGARGNVTVSTAVVDIDQAFIAQTFRLDEPSLTEGRYVHLEVRDTGSGMSEETLSKIFDPFFTTKFTGRGLGLAAVSGILRGHRGAVRVYSQPEQGTTFKVFLPVAPFPPAKAAPKILKSDAPPYKGWGTILFVDDEEIVRKVGQTALRRSGYDLLVAENGKQAVDLFTQHHGVIRLIILDLTMPVMSGDEAISLLRGIDPAIPILLSSGYNQVELIRRFNRQNITGFIQKPYTAKQLTEALAKALA
jgi:PAS domain S-box-containing protein